MTDIVEDDGFEYSLENLDIYKMAIAISDQSWEIYSGLPSELKSNIGNQFLKAADSIGANICEGYGGIITRNRLISITMPVDQRSKPHTGLKDCRKEI